MFRKYSQEGMSRKEGQSDTRKILRAKIGECFPEVGRLGDCGSDEDLFCLSQSTVFRTSIFCPRMGLRTKLSSRIVPGPARRQNLFLVLATSGMFPSWNAAAVRVVSAANLDGVQSNFSIA